MQDWRLKLNQTGFGGAVHAVQIKHMRMVAPLTRRRRRRDDARARARSAKNSGYVAAIGRAHAKQCSDVPLPLQRVPYLSVLSRARRIDGNNSLLDTHTHTHLQSITRNHRSYVFHLTYGSWFSRRSRASARANHARTTFLCAYRHHVSFNPLAATDRWRKRQTI